jgi:hypothetical protein
MRSWPSDRIAFGGDYNPEQWPREIWDEDLALMREAGVTFVTLGVFSWSWLEPAEGEFEFGWLDEIMGLLDDHGIAVDLIPSLASQEGLLAELPREVGRALFVGAERARRLLADELPADFRAVYRTVELAPPPPDGDLVLLASPSAADAWAKLGSTLPAITIGPQTTAAARGAGLTVVAEAVTQDVAGLVDSAALWRASSHS